MAERSAIEWTDATVNFWWGCTKVGPGCDHCYAEAWTKRTGDHVFGLGVPRRKIKGAVSLIYRLHASGAHHRVFVQSMSDLFDKEVPAEWFDEAWNAIDACDSLRIQIVTKRVSFVEKRLAGRAWPQHAGLIISVVNQEEAERDIPRLRELKKRLDIPWVGLSIEPILGPIDLTHLLYHPCPSSLEGISMDPSTGAYECCSRCDWTGIGEELAIDWVIVGGESGKHARPLHPDWVVSLERQCGGAGVPFFFKQWGEFSYDVVGPEHPESISLPIGHLITKRVGKKAAGRRLHGVEHNGSPL